MAQFELNFAQDLKQKISIRHCETMVFTKDNLSNAVRVELYDGSEPYSGGGTVSATAVRSDGITVPITNGSITGNVVTVYLTEAAVDVPGNVGLYVKLTSGDTRTTVLAAIFAAQRTETDSTIDPGTIIPSVTDLINAIDEAVDSIPPDFASLLAGIAPVFSASANYEAGAFVWEEGVLYRFTTAHPAGSWTGTDVVTASMGADFADEISSLKSALSTGKLRTQLDYGTLIDGESVKSSTGAIQTTSGYQRTDYLTLPNVSSIAVKTLSGSGTINALCFYNASKTFISGAVSPTNYDSINIPANAVYAIYSGVTAAMPGTYIIYAGDTIITELQSDILNKADIETFGGKKYVDAATTLQDVAGVIAYPDNLVDIGDCTDNAYVRTDNGDLSLNSSGYFATGYIPVTAGTHYRANHGRNLAWYDSSKTFLSSATGTAIQTDVTAPTNASFIRFTVNKSTDGIGTPAELYFTDATIYSDIVEIPGLLTTAKPWCYGQKINWIGDSIVDGPDFDEVVCSALGLIKASEYGINGSTIALKGDGTDGRNALCLRYSEMSNDADIVAVSCGTNDFEYAWCPIGTTESTENTTFYGALKTLCAGLIAKYPKKLIFFTTPIKRGQPFADGAGGEYTQDGVTLTPFSKNKYGKTLGDYADIIKEVCGYYSIPVLDMYRESLLNPHLTAQQDMFDNVLTHPNSDGQKIMARRVAGWLTQLGYNIT